jgi:hypothetical protein
MNNEFMPFSNYYIWFPLDTCYFKLEDAGEICVFEKIELLML